MMSRLIRRWISLIAIFTAGAGAQTLDFFQMAPQAIQFHSFVGGSFLGVSLAEIDNKRAAELKLKEAYGVEITRVEEGSPAEKAGLKSGDVVLEYNGQRVEGMEQFGRLVRETPPAREVKLIIGRNGATQTVTATVQARKLKSMATVMPNFDMPEIHMPD